MSGQYRLRDERLQGVQLEEVACELDIEEWQLADLGRKDGENSVWQVS